MKKALGVFAAVIVVFVVVVLAMAAGKPNSFDVSRSVVIAAPPEKIKPLIDNFHNFYSWSPWEKLDAHMTKSYTGAQVGTGASYAWKGNSKAGEGRMTILSATPLRTETQLDFVKPFAMQDVAVYTLEPLSASPATTRVTWSMHGPMKFPSKVMAVFSSMDKMVGPDFESGLAQMKTVAER